MLQIGVIGAAVYGSLLLVCVYRTYRYWEVTKGGGDLKFRFHLLLLVNILLELAYFVGFIIEKRYSMWGYQCHLFSLLFHVLSYSVVCRAELVVYLIFKGNQSSQQVLVLWAKALTVSTSVYAILWRFILFLAAVFGCATIINSVYLCKFAVYT